MVRYAETMERMLRVGRLKNVSAVAKVLSVTPQALSNYKKREKFPSDLVIKFSNIYNLSLDWLINGEGGMYLTSSESLKEGQKNISIKIIKPEHLIYIGKLVKIMDSQDEEIAETTRHTIDVFYKAIFLEIEDEDFLNSLDVVS